MADEALRESYDVVVIGAGPAGLAAALNLTRARFEVLVLDSNRPRHSATLKAHGFPTRDGIAPTELRRLGREELEAYDNCEVQFAAVGSVTREGDAFRVEANGVRGTPARSVLATSVVIATGLSEKLPELPSIRAYYGTTLHSCMICDGYEHAGKPLALIGETDDLARQARQLSRWSNDIVVFTGGVAEVSDDDEQELAERGVRVERRALADVVGDRSGLTGVQLADGEVVPRSAGFIRPIYSAPLGFLDSLGVEKTTPEGLLVVDDGGRTSVAGLYAVGDSTPPGPQQLVVAAGAGARAAAAILVDRTSEPAR
ncbi:NAD(P)/FAD-dependent oxidoreductase [Amnibacterium flavum]|uniref:Pyridine nucleotide-disulfide oxidoreductase n=1 Tax=Amnibacterium flavum TaxID=2173173 RepID=A0A2V1HUN2_9MICO|nr:NAD(P)/FAD-dependent oxidoreductase [Amnibacterium flavum]PVZ96011.1 pyridine nucleotide-disulfide oxidoreductase [Amnibacterium flavum]